MSQSFTAEVARLTTESGIEVLASQMLTRRSSFGANNATFVSLSSSSNIASASADLSSSMTATNISVSNNVQDSTTTSYIDIRTIHMLETSFNSPASTAITPNVNATQSNQSITSIKDVESNQLTQTPPTSSSIYPLTSSIIQQSNGSEKIGNTSLPSASLREIETSSSNLVIPRTTSVQAMNSLTSQTAFQSSFSSSKQSISFQSITVPLMSAIRFDSVRSSKPAADGSKFPSNDVTTGVLRASSIQQTSMSTVEQIDPSSSFVSSFLSSTIDSSLYSLSTQQSTATTDSNQMISENRTMHNYTNTVKTLNNYPEKYDYVYEIELTGKCALLENKDALTEIWESLLKIIKDESCSKEKIEPIKLLCEPLRLSFKVPGSPRKNLTEVLEARIKKERFNLTLLVDNTKHVLQAKRIYFYIDDEYDSEIFLMGLNEVDIIVIICATAISLILVCAGLIICAREYYLKKRTRSFTLSSYVSKGSSSYDYTLTKIPRTNGAYTENGVRMKPLSDPDNPKDALLSTDEQETSVSDMHIRFNSNDSGIIVGVTGTAGGSQNLHSRDTLENGDQAGEKLVKNKEESDKSVDNPIYFADDDRFSNV